MFLNLYCFTMLSGTYDRVKSEEQGQGVRNTFQLRTRPAHQCCEATYQVCILNKSRVVLHRILSTSSAMHSFATLAEIASPAFWRYLFLPTAGWCRVHFESQCLVEWVVCVSNRDVWCCVGHVHFESWCLVVCGSCVLRISMFGCVWLCVWMAMLNCVWVMCTSSRETSLRGCHVFTWRCLIVCGAYPLQNRMLVVLWVMCWNGDVWLCVGHVYFKSRCLACEWCPLAKISGSKLPPPNPLFPPWSEAARRRATNYLTKKTRKNAGLKIIVPNRPKMM